MGQRDGRAGQRLPYALQIRFTGTQQAWLVEQTERLDIPTGAVVREVLDLAIAGQLVKRIETAKRLRAALRRGDIDDALAIADELELDVLDVRK